MDVRLQETLASVRAAIAGGYTPQNPTTLRQDKLSKAFTQSLGLVNYDLQEGALKLYPYMESLTPLRNMTPRVPGKGDTATRWKAITGINTSNMKMGVSEGNRGGVISTTTANYSLAYVGLGLEDYVTFEADYAAEQFEDVKADATLGLLQSFFLGEERMIYGGNGSLAIGQTATPTLTANTTGGTIGAGVVVSVICVGLTQDGWFNTGKGAVATGVIQSIVKTNIDGSTDTLQGGSAQKSANNTVTVSGGVTNSVTSLVVPKRGEVAWAWFAGTAGNERLFSITTVPLVTVTSLPGASQLASSLDTNDHSSDSVYQFDGFLTFAMKSGNNAYYANYQTTTATYALTTDTAGSITELNTMFKTMYDSFRLGPQLLLVNSQEANSIYKVVIANGGAPLVRYMQSSGSGINDFVAGAVVSSVLNKITGETVKVMVHPEAVPGTILAISTRIPYKLNGISNVFQIKCRKDYYMQEWPIVKRRWEYGVYADETFQHYAPFSLGIITGLTAN